MSENQDQTIKLGEKAKPVENEEVEQVGQSVRNSRVDDVHPRLQDPCQHLSEKSTTTESHLKLEVFEEMQNLDEYIQNIDQKQK